jgi:hypothetical protein
MGREKVRRVSAAARQWGAVGAAALALARLAFQRKKRTESDSVCFFSLSFFSLHGTLLVRLSLTPSTSDWLTWQDNDRMLELLISVMCEVSWHPGLIIAEVMQLNFRK